MQGRTNVGGGGGFEEKTITAGTSQVVVEAAQGKAFKKVTVNPTPSQSKTATPTTEEQTVRPDNGKLLSFVEIGAIQAEEKTVQAGTSAKEVTPEDGKFLEKVTVNPTPAYATSATPTPEGRVLTPSSGYYFSKVTLNPFELAGENVWKKCYVASTSEYLSNIAFTASPEGGNSMYYPLPTDTYPFLASLTNWVDFFDGFAIIRGGLDYTLSKVGSELHLIRNSEDKGAMTYENGVLGFPFGWGSTDTAEFSYSGEKTAQYEGAGTFIDFVVSDNASAYPAFGKHTDGYWYEPPDAIEYTSGTADLTEGVSNLAINTFYFVTE